MWHLRDTNTSWGHKGPVGYMSLSGTADPVCCGPARGFTATREEMPQEMPLRLEAGTPNEHSFAGLAAALQWRKKNPVDGVSLQMRTEETANRLVASRRKGG